MYGRFSNVGVQIISQLEKYVRLWHGYGVICYFDMVTVYQCRTLISILRGRGFCSQLIYSYVMLLLLPSCEKNSIKHVDMVGCH